MGDDVAYNCASQTNQYAISWGKTISSSVSVSYEAEYKAFKAGVSYTFSEAETRSSQGNINLPTKYKGWFEYAPAMRYSGGYMYVYDGYNHSLKSKTWETGRWHDPYGTGAFVMKDDPMSSYEIDKYCN